MRAKLKSGLQYFVLLTISFGLLWLAFRQIQVEEGQSRWAFLSEVWSYSHKGFLLASALAAILSHAIRAERWKLLLRPAGYKIGFRDSFLAVMVGYFVNLAIPRGGEIARSYNLLKTTKVPVDVSFGTIIAERIIDMLLLLILIGVAFLFEFESLVQFFRNMDQTGADQSGGIPWMWILGSLMGIVIIFYIFFRVFLFYKKLVVLRLGVKFRGIWKGFKNGLSGVFRMKQTSLFLLYSLLIWVGYYLMSVTVMHAFPETNQLGWIAALSIFAIGGIAMAIPLPGGVGSYHVLVPLGLVVLYQLPEDRAIAFTIIFHGIQTLVTIILGFGALVYSISIQKNQKKLSF